MNIDRIFAAFNENNVDYILIGGMNYFLRHAPVSTVDIDLWIDDTPANRRRAEHALAQLDAQWGRTDADWGPVAAKPPDWSAEQGVFCLASRHGSIDLFRSVLGLDSWAQCRDRATRHETSGGVSFISLADADMLRCQTALPAHEQKLDRMRGLKQALEDANGT